MRPSIRIAVAAVRASSQSTSRSGFVCLQCRQRASVAAQQGKPSIPTSYTSQRHASSMFNTEKYRKKIWGTSDPPGQKDPYEREDSIDSSKALNEKEAELPPASEVVRESSDDELTREQKLEDEGYVAATTWDGLERIGGKTGWWEEAWDQQHQFTGSVLRISFSIRRLISSSRFMVATKLESKEDISAAIQRALVEIYALLDAGRPLAVKAKFPDGRGLPALSGISFLQSTTGAVTLGFDDEQLREKIVESTSWTEEDHEDSQTEIEVGVAEEAAPGITKAELSNKISSGSATGDTGNSASEQDDASETKESESLELPEAPEETLLETASTDDSWRNLPLLDPHVKFAVSSSSPRAEDSY